MVPYEIDASHPIDCTNAKIVCFLESTWRLKELHTPDLFIHYSVLIMITTRESNPFFAALGCLALGLYLCGLCCRMMSTTAIGLHENCSEPSASAFLLA